MNRRILLLSFLSFIFLWGCHKNIWDIDISKIETNQQFERFERDLFQTPTDSIWRKVPFWEGKYGAFFEAYNHRIISIGGTNQLDYDEKLAYFLTDPYIVEAYNEVQRVFPDLNFKNELSDAFKRFHYYFPEYTIPTIYTHVSGFNQSLVVDSAYISISLDKYLGTESKFYGMLRTPMYLRYTMRPDKISSDVMLAVGLTEFQYAHNPDNLVSQMIYHGKIQVFLDAMLPHLADTVKWGMPDAKLRWCEKNERQMWMYLIENKLLFSSDYKDIKRYIDDGPFTSTFSRESPSRTGRWLGYQIVKSYLKQHPEITLQELMQLSDYQQILSNSKYKP
ncbi:MAG: hypothetical protein AB7E36_05305 [Salinivirgaceae bacterium]